MLRLAFGTGTSPCESLVLRRRSSIAPRSFHLMPESSTAIVTSGRPVVVAQARSPFGVVASTRCAPRTPCSSRGSEFTGSFPASWSAAYIQDCFAPEVSSLGRASEARRR